MGATKRICIVTALLLAASTGWADDISRSARLVKDAGNQFLAAKKYADAIDCYLQAVEIHPEFSEAHYNLGVSFLKGYKAMSLAAHHFEQYLRLEPDADDYDDVSALVRAMHERIDPPEQVQGKVIGTVAGRLLVSGSNWAKRGDRIEVADRGKEPCARLLAEYVYPDCVLSQRVWDEETLEQLKPGQVAANLSQQIYER